MDSWLIKMFGDQQAYVLTTKDGGNAVYSVGSVKSLRWPGAYTVFQSGRWLSIYIGNGVKASSISFQPIAPQEIKEDPDDIDEFPEPNPKDALEKLESDTDAVKPDEPAAAENA
jgi:radial spoke head protein 4A